MKIEDIVLPLCFVAIGAALVAIITLSVTW